MPWPQDAYVGQEVVCVLFDEKITYDTICRAHPLVVNETYRILEITAQTNRVYFRVQNLPPFRIWWLSHQFRPIQSTKTGMSILRGLLVPNKELVDA